LPKRLTIVWDVDDVLNDLTARWFAGWRAACPDCKIDYSELRENPPHTRLGISHDDYLRSLDQFRQAAAERSLPPRPELVNWFTEKGDAYRHLALSAVPLAFAPLSAAWVTKNFGKWIGSFNFVPSFRSETGHPQALFSGKKHFLDWFGKADLLVEDNENNAAAARELGITAVVFPQPWNSHAGGDTAGFLKRLDSAIAEMKELL
jgi:beta-phosphoglucomutase-like phosphatase (HAD superfamily)